MIKQPTFRQSIPRRLIGIGIWFVVAIAAYVFMNPELKPSTNWAQSLFDVLGFVFVLVGIPSGFVVVYFPYGDGCEPGSGISY